jgi:hypothetical protein
MVTNKTNFNSITMLLIFIFSDAYSKILKLSGSANRFAKPQKLNSDISPHRAGIFIYLCFAST